MPKLLVIAVHSLPKIRSINFKHTNGLKWTKMRKCYKIVLNKEWLLDLRATIFTCSVLWSRVLWFPFRYLVGYRSIVSMYRKKGKENFQLLLLIITQSVMSIHRDDGPIQGSEKEIRVLLIIKRSTKKSWHVGQVTIP
jgi:hypothetical protein